MISVYWDKVVPLTWGLREPRTFLWPPTLQTHREGKDYTFYLLFSPHIFLIFLNQAGSVTWWRRATPSSSKLHWGHRGAGLGSLTLPTSQCSFQFVSEHLHFCLKSLRKQDCDFSTFKIQLFSSLLSFKYPRKDAHHI